MRVLLLLLCFQMMNAQNYKAFILSDSVAIDFDFSILDNKLLIYNGVEAIEVIDWNEEEGLNWEMPIFGSQINLVGEKGHWKGEWNKYPSKNNYKMPILAFAENEVPDSLRFVEKGVRIDLSGKWSVQFSPETEDEYIALGEFEQNGRQLTGTFRTTTGDYRFLNGEVSGNNFYLSCFDGSHAFLFRGKLENDQITGSFWSGKHWYEPWRAEKNEAFTLPDPYDLTYLKENEAFTFSVENGDESIDMNHALIQGKVVLLQILGSWCPNCMDETRLFTELFQDYSEKGLQIVGVAFERAETVEDAEPIIDKYKRQLNIQYPIYFGGKASKKTAGEVFPSLNKIISFPTSILIDKSGKVRQIHTGFNGPATSVYDQYVEQLRALISDLLQE